MENNIKVSIIVTSYQCEKYIQKALDSLINQNFPHDYEIIIVDDGSKDLTISLIQKYMKLYSFIHLYEVSYHNVAKVRQKGIKEAKGDYICFLDGDDCYHKNMLSIMYNTINKKDADIINCSLYYVRKNYASRNIFSLTKSMDSPIKSIDSLFFDCYMHGFMHTKMYKANLIKQVVLDIEYPTDNFVYEDYLTNYYIFKKANKVVSISKPVVYYNKTNTQSITKVNLNRSQDFINVLAKIRSDIDLHNDAKLLKIFKKYKFRSYLSLLASIKVCGLKQDSHYKKEIKRLKNEFEKVYAKQMPVRNVSYSFFVSALKVKD